MIRVSHIDIMCRGYFHDFVYYSSETVGAWIRCGWSTWSSLFSSARVKR